MTSQWALTSSLGLRCGPRSNWVSWTVMPSARSRALLRSATCRAISASTSASPTWPRSTSVTREPSGVRTAGSSAYGPRSSLRKRARSPSWWASTVASARSSAPGSSFRSSSKTGHMPFQWSAAAKSCSKNQSWLGDRPARPVISDWSARAVGRSVAHPACSAMVGRAKKSASVRCSPCSAALATARTPRRESPPSA